MLARLIPLYKATSADIYVRVSDTFFSVGHIFLPVIDICSQQPIHLVLTEAVDREGPAAPVVVEHPVLSSTAFVSTAGGSLVQDDEACRSGRQMRRQSQLKDPSEGLEELHARAA